MRLLLVEDDDLLGDAVRHGLMQYGYTVDWAKDGQTALQAILTEKFDLIILDIGLPKRSGLEVLKSVRGKSLGIPVIILTARETVEDRVKGLDAGADDYMTKPFDLEELCARIRAMLRRSVSRADPMITYGEHITLDPASHSVFKEGELMNISRREYALLHKLLENVGRVISRDQLTQTLYGWGDEVDSNALEVHVHNLRKKFGTNFIRTIRGVGYMIEKPDKQK